MQLNSILMNWLSTNKISEKVQTDFGISFTDKIVFPVYDIDGNFLFNKYRRSPTSEEGAKYTYDYGGKVTLYGYHKAKDHKTILITEGEKDCLVAWSHNIPAVTSTGGAQSFQRAWQDLFIGKDVIICYDNDDAGAQGVVRTLEILPFAKVLFIPDIPNVKDISDYVNVGGDLHELIKTARHFASIADVAEDRIGRIAMFRSVKFHDAYIKTHTKVNTFKGDRKSYSSDEITNAKAYPISNLLSFNQNKVRCIFHADTDASLHYYPKDNRCYCFGSCGKSYDAISIYMKLNGVGFKEAVNKLNTL